MANFLTLLFSNGASSLASAVGVVIDKVVTYDEEREELDNELTKTTMQYETQMAALGLQEKQTYLTDVDSAHVNQSHVQECEHASWLAKNIHPLLAFSITGLTFILYIVVSKAARKKASCVPRPRTSTSSEHPPPSLPSSPHTSSVPVHLAPTRARRSMHLRSGDSEMRYETNATESP